MINRRHALKTIAGATVVGSLSGCVQLATQRTTHFHGIPAMFTSSSGSDWNATTAVGVGVEARKSIERFGVETEIVAHSWGMLYASTAIGLVSEDDPQVGSLGVVATFTTPSIEIAGRELNPIAELTVSEIGGEFSTTASPVAQAGTDYDQPEGGSALLAHDRGTRVNTTVDDATGKMVLRAFRDAVSDGKSVEGNAVIDFQDKGWDEEGTTFPGWDGDTYAFVFSNIAGTEVQVAIRFDKHDGDFVVLFGAGRDGSAPVLEYVSTAELVQKTAPWTVRPDLPKASDQTIIHPADDQFSLDQLDLHLVDTNLRGMQDIVSRARKIIDETLELLATASDRVRNDSDLYRVMSDTQNDLNQLDTILVGLGENLQSVTVDKDGNFYARSTTLDRVRERSKKAAEIATQIYKINGQRYRQGDMVRNLSRQIAENLASLVELAVTNDQLSGSVLSDQ